jgi:hypothetical protein
MKKKMLVLLLGLSLILMFAFATACSKKESAEETTAVTEKAYTLEIVSRDGSSKSYEGSTSQEFLKGAMDELAEKGDFSYEEADGMITTINGERADYNADGAYWAIYVNGDYGQFGADQQPVSDGDAYKFEYTSAQ